MTREELLKYADKIINAYKTIPAESFRNAITGESLLDSKQYKEQGYNDSLPYPAAMCPRQKVEQVNVGFYPVYFYDDGTNGVIISFFSTSKKQKMSFGPFRSSEGLVDELMKYEGIGNYDFICNRMKMFAGFIKTYDEALAELRFKMKDYPELPIMSCVDNVEFIGETLDIATEYIVNPYAYDTPMFRNVHMSVFDNMVNKSVLIASEKSFEGWEAIDHERISKVLKKIRTSLDEKRKREDELIKEVEGI